MNRPRRPLSITPYLPIWHSDAMSFILATTHRSSLPTGAKHVFSALWIPDILCDLSLAIIKYWPILIPTLRCLFESMDRLRSGRIWSVFDPVDVPALRDAFGPDFTALYEEYETSGLAIHEYDVDDIWAAVYQSQTETGTPYIVFQDNVNSAVLVYFILRRIIGLQFQLIHYYSPKQRRALGDHPFG